VTKSSSSKQLYTIIVGNKNDSFVCYAVDLMGDLGIEATVYEDVYSATAVISKKISQDVLVVGRLKPLSAERGRFFQKIEEKGLFCCCLRDKLSVQKQQYRNVFQSNVCDRSCIVINKPDEIKAVLTKLLADSKLSLSNEKKNNSSAFNKADFNLTGAERDALLGV